jgi:hypothetical protein
MLTNLSVTLVWQRDVEVQNRGLNVNCNYLKHLGSELDDLFLVPGRATDWTFSSSPPRPDRPWGPPSLLSNRCQDKAAGA